MATAKKISKTAKKASSPAKKAKASTPAKPALKAKASPKATTKAAKIPSAKAIADFVGLTLKPALTKVNVQRLRRALPGYVSILDDIAELLEEDAAELNLKDVTPAALLDAQARQKALAAREAVLEAAYMSSYHQRLVVDDEAVGMLRTIARRVQSRAEENPELPIRYKAMLDFLASFQGGRKPGSKAAAPAEGS
jgi:hypothetical protein